MEERLLKLAAQIITKANDENPADAVMRQILRTATGLTRAESRLISRSVFHYYRWQGWVDQSQSVIGRLYRSEELAETFLHRPQTFTDEKLLANGFPSWVPEHVEITGGWARYLQSDPQLWLRAQKGQGRALAWKFAKAKPGPLPDSILFQGEEDLFRSEDFHAGEFEVQDIASQAVSRLCDPQPGETWWDACAGEGGKTLHLSSLMENKGLIWASDRADWRLKKLKLRAGRARCFNYRSVLWNGGEKLPTKTKFHGILVDAPCSGIGTWQRNPHARWTTHPQDIRELAEIQKNLLRNVANSLKPGGKLIYSVCTLSKAETTEVAEFFTKEFPEFTPLPLPDPFNEKGKPQPQHFFWPQEVQGNGMYIAAWKKPA